MLASAPLLVRLAVDRISAHTDGENKALCHQRMWLKHNQLKLIFSSLLAYLVLNIQQSNKFSSLSVHGLSTAFQVIFLQMLILMVKYLRSYNTF